MNVEIVPLTYAHLEKLPLPDGLDQRAYFIDGSVACCVLADGEPVFAGGIVNQFWNRGEAWILPTDWFRKHPFTCFKAMRKVLPQLAHSKGFRRVQAVCMCGTSASLFRHLGFHPEGRLSRFGPDGEDCFLWSRIFEVTK